ncbi:hypothetical protein [Rhodopila sp.]|uniref:hypothetical protein n=1 Tax=Rhodopila sp. TaxID=2480087 RepID=UPI003D111CA0
MSDDPADRLTKANRISIQAVLVPEGHDPVPLLLANGIYEPVAIPFVVDDDAFNSGGILGDGVTPNVVATLDFGEQEPTDATSGQSAPDPSAADAAGQAAEKQAAPTVTLPAAYGIKPLAPVRKRWL